MYPPKNFLSPISLKVHEIIVLVNNNVYKKFIQINLFMEVLETFFHQLYAESNGYCYKIVHLIT